MNVVQQRKTERKRNGRDREIKRVKDKYKVRDSETGERQKTEDRETGLILN